MFFIPGFRPEIDAIDITMCKPQASVVRMVFCFIGALFDWPAACHVDVITEGKNRIEVRLGWPCRDIVAGDQLVSPLDFGIRAVEGNA